MESRNNMVLVNPDIQYLGVLGIRSDTREPLKGDKIMEFGFQRRGGGWDQYSSHSLQIVANGSPAQEEIENNKIYLYLQDNKIMIAGRHNGQVIRDDLSTELDPFFEDIKKLITSGNPNAKLPSEAVDKIYKELAGKYKQPTHQIEEPTYRTTTNDIIPSSAVCITLAFDCAPIFPESGEETWLYFVNVEQAFQTYSKQAEKNSELQFAQEVAARDVASGEIIAAIKCKRFWHGDEIGNDDWKQGMHYQLVGDVIWNPKLQNEIQTPSKQKRNQEIINFVAARKDHYVECPIPQTNEEWNAVKKGTYRYELKFISELDHAKILERKAMLRQSFDLLLISLKDFEAQASSKSSTITKLPNEILQLANRVDTYQNKQTLQTAAYYNPAMVQFLQEHMAIFQGNRISKSPYLLLSDANKRGVDLSDALQLLYYLDQIEKQLSRDYRKTIWQTFLPKALDQLAMAAQNQSLVNLGSLANAFVDTIHKQAQMQSARQTSTVQHNDYKPVRSAYQYNAHIASPMQMLQSTQSGMFNHTESPETKASPGSNPDWQKELSEILATAASPTPNASMSKMTVQMLLSDVFRDIIINHPEVDIDAVSQIRDNVRQTLDKLDYSAVDAKQINKDSIKVLFKTTLLPEQTDQLRKNFG